mmetsp:Transcript_94934/g.188015  ORF Transcript_94934/g.188015 Transcript_94934/m.188015 type:complete len:81 (+) Transcript_94934:2722-2964(+)
MQQRARIAARAPQVHFAELVAFIAAAVAPLHAQAGVLRAIMHHSVGSNLWANSVILQESLQIVAAMEAAVQLVAAQWPNS